MCYGEPYSNWNSFATVASKSFTGKTVFNSCLVADELQTSTAICQSFQYSLQNSLVFHGTNFVHQFSSILILRLCNALLWCKQRDERKKPGSNKLILNEQKMQHVVRYKWEKCHWKMQGTLYLSISSHLKYIGRW